MNTLIGHLQGILNTNIKNSIIVIKDDKVYSFSKDKGALVVKSKDSILVIEEETNTIYFL